MFIRILPTVLTLTCLMLSSFASADSFTVIQDGQEYLCEPTQPIPGAPMQCAQTAYNGPFTRSESEELCAGAVNLGPATCGIEAYQGPFTKSEAIELCRGTHKTVNGPSDCAVKAFNGPFTKSESVELCSRTGTVQTADCAITAFQGPYSKQEAIRLCKQGNPELLMRSLQLLQSSPEMRRKVQMMKLQRSKDLTSQPESPRLN